MATQHYDESAQQRHARPTSNVGAIIGWGLTILIALAMLAMIVPEIVARYAPLWRQQPDAVVTPASPAPPTAPQLFYGQPVIEQPAVAPVAAPAPTAFPTALPTALPPAQAEHSRPAKQGPGARVQAVPAAAPAPAPTEAPGGIDLDTSIHVGSDGIQLGGAVSIKNAPTSGGVVAEHSRPAKQGPPR